MGRLGNQGPTLYSHRFGQLTVFCDGAPPKGPPGLSLHHAGPLLNPFKKELTWHASPRAPLRHILMNSSIQISNWNELALASGIKSLTGEACKFSQRLLCDVNEDGLALLQDFFGIPELKLADPWNSSVNDKPSVGSIMLARAMWEPLAEFVFARKHALAAIYVDNRVSCGIFDADLLARYEAANLPHHDIHRYPGPSNAPTVRSRNVHAATGRAL